MDATEYTKGLKKSKTDTDTFSKDGKKGLGGLGDAFKSVTGFSLGMAGAIGIAGVAIQKTAKYLIEAEAAANESNIVMAKQEAILKATGYAAGLTSEQLQNMADQSSKLTGIDDELIANSQSVLLTFRNIGQNEFPRAQQAALDLQTTFGDLNTSSMMLGKALNDPIKGVTALGKAGVTFSEEQKKQIKYFAETNQLAKAQAIILSEVERQVGGTAAAMNAASDGADSYKVSAENLKEAIGQSFVTDARTMHQLLTIINIKMAEGINKTNDFAKSAEALGYTFIMSGVWIKDWKLTTADAIKEQIAATQSAYEEAKAIIEVGESAQMAEDELEAFNKAQLSITESVMSAETSFNEKYKSLMEERTQLEADKTTATGEKLDEINADLAENSAAIQKNADDYELAKNKILLGYTEQLLAADGLTQEEVNFLLQKGQEWGIYSETAVAEMQAVISEATALTGSLNTIPKQIKISMLTEHVDTYYVVGSQGTAVNRHALGGTTIAGSTSMVNERGVPEIVSVGNKDYLTMGSQNGTVTPLSNTNDSSDTDKIIVNALMSVIASNQALPRKIAHEIRQLEKYG